MLAAFGTALSLVDTVLTQSQTKASSTTDNAGVQFVLPDDDASSGAVSQPATATSAQTSTLSPQMLGQVFQSQSQSHGRMGLPVFPQDETTQNGVRPSPTPQTSGNSQSSAPGIQIVDGIDTTQSVPGIQIVDGIDTTHSAPGIQIVDGIDTSHSAPGIQIVDGIGDPTSTFSQGGSGGINGVPAGGQTQTSDLTLGLSSLVAQTYVSQMMRVQTDLPLLESA